MKKVYVDDQLIGEARDVPYEVAYTLLGKLSDDLASLYAKWRKWDRRPD